MHQVHRLGYAPSPNQVHAWLLELGLESEVVGQSLQGRDLAIYRHRRRPRLGRGRPTLLLLSLVHGNEPLGLLSLLSAVEQILVANLAVDLVVFPIVNIDAYAANLAVGQGCRRSNLRQTCFSNATKDYSDAYQCPTPSFGGVDLNRNHPRDWSGDYADTDGDDPQLGSPCGITYKGAEPWSEPESRTIRDLVELYRPSAALSFHTRSSKSSAALLIHPPTSSRPIAHATFAKRYHAWNALLNPENRYNVGSAQQVIGYTASGSTIDWMDSVGVMSYVLESSAPCGDRWCTGDETSAVTWQDGGTGRRLAELVVKSHGSAAVPWARVGVGMLAVLIAIRSLAFYRRRRRKGCRNCTQAKLKGSI